MYIKSLPIESTIFAKKMFDLERVKILIAEHFFKQFRKYNKPKLTDQFIRRWLQLLLIYSQIPNFVSFHDKAPKLNRLYPKARAVLVVPFEDFKLPFFVPNVSVFPLYPFKTYLKHKSICCREGIELLQLYLEISDIKIVGFYKVMNYKSVIDTLLEKDPSLHCYPPSLLTYFCRFSNKVSRNARSHSTFST